MGISYFFLWMATAHASSSFPATIQDYTGAPCEAPCALCHDGTPGMGTANTDFAVAARDRGLAAGDDVALTAALDAMTTDGVDSDGDGVADVDEISAGTNPNAGGADLCTIATPTYGCLNTATTAGFGWLGVLVALGLVASRRRDGVSASGSRASGRACPGRRRG